MVARNTTTIACNSDCLSYETACEIANQAVAVRGHEAIHLELQRVAETTTAALARLIALRCSLRKAGRDLDITGLCGQAESIYEFNQMAALLPRYRHTGD